jgi:hypothetical protein
MRSTRILCCLFVLLAAGCAGGGDGDDGDTGSGTSVDPAAYGVAAPGPGNVLLAFVQAAGSGEADAMWGMLSGPTQASIGPSLDEFRATTATELQEGLGTLAKTARVILSRELPESWGVAAIAGEREVEGDTEYYAYGVALAQESGQWKIELGGVVITGLKPDPLAETEGKPAIKASVGAGGDLQQVLMWLDGEPLAFARGGNSPFTAMLSAKPATPLAPGRHELVAFGASDLTASAVAWTFSVQG